MKSAVIVSALVVSILLAVGGETVGAQALAPEAVPPGVTRRPVLKSSLGTPLSMGWKWLAQERAGPQATGTLRHDKAGFYYTLEGTHELVLGDNRQTFPMDQAVLVPLEVEHIHRMLPLDLGGRKLEVYFARGDESRPAPRGVKILHFSEKPIEVRSSVSYTLRAEEFTLASGVRWELTQRIPSIYYVLEGIMTQRAGDQVFRTEHGSVLEPALATPFTVSNEGTMPMRYLVLELVPTPAPITPPR